MLFRSVLRAGVCEIRSRPEVRAPVIINDYVGIAGAFFDRGEPGMVNAVLDRVARLSRPGEFETGGPARG